MFAKSSRCPIQSPPQLGRVLKHKQTNCVDQRQLPSAAWRETHKSSKPHKRHYCVERGAVGSCEDFCVQLTRKDKLQLDINVQRLCIFDRDWQLRRGMGQLSNSRGWEWPAQFCKDRQHKCRRGTEMRRQRIWHLSLSRPQWDQLHRSVRAHRRDIQCHMQLKIKFSLEPRGWERTLYPSCRDGSPFEKPRAEWAVQPKQFFACGEKSCHPWLYYGQGTKCTRQACSKPSCSSEKLRHQLMGPDGKGHGRNWTGICCLPHRPCIGIRSWSWMFDSEA